MAQPPMGTKNGVTHSVFHPSVRKAPLVKNPGGLHRSLGVPVGQKIPAAKIDAAAKRPGLVGKQARFAQALTGK